MQGGCQGVLWEILLPAHCSHYTLSTIHYTEYSAHCTVHTLYTVNYKLWTIHHTEYIKCPLLTLYTIQYTLYRVEHCIHKHAFSMYKVPTIRYRTFPMTLHTSLTIHVWAVVRRVCRGSILLLRNRVFVNTVHSVCTNCAKCECFHFLPLTKQQKQQQGKRRRTDFVHLSNLSNLSNRSNCNDVPRKVSIVLFL